MKGNDLTGCVFGRIAVLRYLYTTADGRNHVWECKCKCGNVFQIKGVQLTRTRGAKTCDKCHVTDGKNDIPTFAPWMGAYFKDPDDIYRYTYGSGKKVLVVCPDCGNEKYITVKDLYRHRGIGCVCSDKVSYPEKFMFSFLKQQEVDFIYQYSPEWIGDKRYDFYIEDKNLIIEVDGGIGHGHRYTFNGFTPEELKEIDEYKDNMAKEHGLDVIRINAYPSTYETIVYSIMQKLSGIFNIDKVDFDKCDEFGMTNLAKQVCMDWIEIKNINSLTKKYGLSRPTIRSYLKRGAKFGWCDYDVREQIEKNILNNGNEIDVYRDNVYLGRFVSCAEFARVYNEMQSEIFINKLSFANATNKNKPYKGLVAKKVEHE